MHIGQPREPLHEPQGSDEPEADRVRQADEEEKRVDRRGIGLTELHHHRRAQQHRGDDEADRNERRQSPPQRLLLHYVSLLMRSKIGMYIAMTMPPTAPPRNAIINGSISVSNPSTATSTSSS